ncbi:MAG: hypothetical protein ABSF00_09660 [Candidatus Bathyarchaeia archaeon]|jgi:hypothetical protein
MSSKEKETVSVSFDKSQFSELINVLHSLVKVLAAAQLKSEDTARNARFLRSFGLSQSEIGDILGKTQQAIALALETKKKETKKPKTGKKDSNDSIEES